MTIEFQCPSCQATLRIPDNAIGRTVRCPNCQNTSVVPKPVVPPTKPDFSAPSYGDYPEQNIPYGQVQSSPMPYLPTRQMIVDRVTPCSIVWLIFSILNFGFLMMAAVGGGIDVMENGWTEDNFFTAVGMGIMGAFSIIGALGALAMLKMRFHTFCVVGAVASIIGGIGCCFVPSGIGIWALVVLVMPGTRAVFR